MNRKVIVSVTAVFISILVGALFIVVERRVSLKTKAQQAFQTAQRLCENNKWKEGRRILTSNQDTLVRWFANPDKWNTLILDCSIKLGDRLSVISLYSKIPGVFENREGPSLWVCRFFLSRSRYDEYDALRALWRGREQATHLWLNLDADRFISMHEYEQARELLFASKFEGKKDAGRLVRCAFMTCSQDLQSAIEYLRKATEADPKDPDVHLFRGQIFEALKRNNEAEFEYRAACVAGDQNPLYRGRLGDFYRRRNMVEKAIRIWDSGTEKVRPDFLSRNIYFWNKMVTGRAFGIDEITRTREQAKVPRYILSLSPNRFWDETLFRELQIAHTQAQKSQELFWLKLAGKIHRGTDEEIGAALAQCQFTESSFSVDILNGLKLVNMYRRMEQFPERITNTSSSGVHSQKRHSFFRELESVQYRFSLGEEHFIDSDLKNFITGPNAYSAVFLAGGWFNCACTLAFSPDGKIKPFSGDVPVWYRYGMAVAVNQVYGPALALACLGKVFPQERVLVLLKCEYLISLGKTGMAEQALNILAGGRDQVAYRSAFLLANMRAQARDYDGALMAVERCRTFSESDTGITLKARICHSKGQSEQAVAMYKMLKEPTAEQIGYLAKSAETNGQAAQYTNYMKALGEKFGTNLDVREYIIDQC